jgi:hypothetical protein
VAPQTFDLRANYEPSAGYALSPIVRRGLKQLAKQYRRPTLMTGRHSGKPVLHTDIKGISVGTRIEVSRLVLRRSAQAKVLADAFRLFVEAADRGIASGPIRRIVLHFHKAAKLPHPRAAARKAFAEVFESDCCFLANRKHELELGRAVEHQTLLEHLRESGPYHSDHQPRVEAVQSELNLQPGRYENHRFFVEPLAVDAAKPRVRFCYSGERANKLVETAMGQKTDERLAFITPGEVAARSAAFVSLADYEHASRRFGTLWVMQGDLIRALDRQRASALYLFLDESARLQADRWFTWQQLYDRLEQCPHIGRASRQSPSFLDMSLDELTDSDFVIHEKQSYRLAPKFDSYRHVRFYELGQYDKRLD